MVVQPLTAHETSAPERDANPISTSAQLVADFGSPAQKLVPVRGGTQFGAASFRIQEPAVRCQEQPPARRGHDSTASSWDSSQTTTWAVSCVFLGSSDPRNQIHIDMSSHTPCCGLVVSVFLRYCACGDSVDGSARDSPRKARSRRPGQLQSQRNVDRPRVGLLGLEAMLFQLSSPLHVMDNFPPAKSLS
jgi:hypothetical protein